MNMSNSVFSETLERDWNPRALARNIVTELEDIEAKNSGVAVKAAREAVARRVKLAPGALARIRKGDRKRIGADELARLVNESARVVAGKIAGLNHQLMVLRQMGADPRDDEFTAIEAALAALRNAPTLPERNDR